MGGYSPSSKIAPSNASIFEPVLYVKKFYLQLILGLEQFLEFVRSVLQSVPRPFLQLVGFVRVRIHLIL